jgi:hypothetical protein
MNRANFTLMPTALKHRQHQVCRAYLRGWAIDEKLWVLQNGQVRRASIRDVAVQRHFYKLEALSSQEIAFLRIWIEKSPAQSRTIHENLLRQFTSSPTLRAAMSEAEVAANPELVASLDEQIINLQEEFYSRLENRVAPQIESLRRGDVGFFGKDNLAAQFAHFLAFQHFRTSGIRERTIARLKERVGLDISRCWPTLSHILASNVGLTIFLDRKRSPLVLLENQTSMPFITSDQPTVNLLGANSGDKGPDHLALYYPVSPRFAVLLDDPDVPCGFGGNALSVDDVHKLNAQQVRMSHRQVFGSTRDAVKNSSGSSKAA